MNTSAGVHAAWLPPESLQALGSRRVLVLGTGALVATVLDEVRAAVERFGGSVAVRAGEPAGLVLAVAAAAPGLVERFGGLVGAEGYLLARADGVTVVLADEPAGLLYGLFHVVRLGEAAFDGRPGRPSVTGRRCGGGCSTTGTTSTCTR